MKAVIDTNVLVSALLIPLSIPGEILLKVFEKQIILIYDNRILVEYINVLNREKLKLNKDLVKIVIEFIKKEGNFIVANQTNTSFTDESDKKFYEVFKTSHAQFLVTGNIKHYPKEENIITPKAFWSHFNTLNDRNS